MDISPSTKRMCCDRKRKPSPPPPSPPSPNRTVIVYSHSCFAENSDPDQRLLSLFPGARLRELLPSFLLESSDAVDATTDPSSPLAVVHVAAPVAIFADRHDRIIMVHVPGKKILRIFWDFAILEKSIEAVANQIA